MWKALVISDVCNIQKIMLPLQLHDTPQVKQSNKKRERKESQLSPIADYKTTIFGRSKQ